MNILKLFMVARARFFGAGQLQIPATLALAQGNLPVTGRLEIRYLLRVIDTGLRVVGGFETSDKLTRPVGNGFVIVITEPEKLARVNVHISEVVYSPFKILSGAVT